MAENRVSISIVTDSKKAAQDFKSLTDQIHATEMAARRVGAGFQSMGNAAEQSLGRIAARAAQARREIEQMTRAQQGGPTFGAATGRGFTSAPGGLSAEGRLLLGGAAGAIGAAASYAAYTGYNEAREQARAQAYLANAAKQTGQAFAVQAAEAAKLRRELGLTTAQATQLQAASLRFTGTIGRPQEAAKLTRALANALAAAGRGTDEIPDSLRQLATGQDELFDKLGPVKIGKTYAGSPETIYRAYAKEILNVKRELTDLEKTQARYYAVLQAGAAAEGAAAERMKSNIGQIDALKNSLSDLAGQLATSAINSETFTDGLSTATRTVNLLKQSIDNLNAAKGGSGSGTSGSGLGGGDPVAFGYALYKQGLDQLEYYQKNPTANSRRSAQLNNITSAFGIDIGDPFTRIQEMYQQFQQATSPAAIIAGAQKYLTPGRSKLDDPFYLARDPFAWQSAAEQNDPIRRKFALQQAHAIAAGVVPGISSAYSSIIGAGDRLAGLGVAGETPQQRAARVFSLSGSVQKDAAEAYRIGGYSASEARSMAEAEARRFRIATLGNVGAGDLTADQEAAYREDLKKFQEDQLKQARETLIEAVKSRKALEKIAGKLAPDSPEEPEPVVIQLDNRADVVARFSLIAEGDSLTGSGPRGDA